VDRVACHAYNPALAATTASRIRLICRGFRYPPKSSETRIDNAGPSNCMKCENLERSYELIARTEQPLVSVASIDYTTDYDAQRDSFNFDPAASTPGVPRPDR
jgi:hypothetical protein